MNKKKKILLVFQENIFKKCQDQDVDFFTTGNCFTPLAEKYTNTWSNSLKIAWRLITRQYSVLFIPTPNVDFEWDTSPAKRRVRHLFKKLLKSKVFRFLIKRLVAGKKVIVLDRFYFSSVQYDMWSLFGPSSDYYTTNLSVNAHRSYNNKKIYPEVGTVYQFPLYIDAEKYPVSTSNIKDIDIFFSGKINSPSREEALTVLKDLKAKGYKIVLNTDRLEMKQYMDYMQRSLLCLSPAGLGYDCFRHYEIMLAGSVPLINAPHHPLMIDLHDGKNCFIYRDGPELSEKLATLLPNKQKLIDMGAALRKDVMNTNDINSIGKALLERYVTDKPGHFSENPLSSFNMLMVR